MTIASGQTARFDGLRVLIIEDETLVALLLEDMLSELGCTVAGSASTVPDALELVAGSAAEVVILDINLGGEPSYAVAEALAAAGVPFVFATGYADDRIQEPWHDRPILQKPFGQEQLAAALAAAVAPK